MRTILLVEDDADGVSGGLMEADDLLRALELPLRVGEVGDGERNRLIEGGEPVVPRRPRAVPVRVGGVARVAPGAGEIERPGEAEAHRLLARVAARRSARVRRRQLGIGAQPASLVARDGLGAGHADVEHIDVWGVCACLGLRVGEGQRRLVVGARTGGPEAQEHEDDRSLHAISFAARRCWRRANQT